MATNETALPATEDEWRVRLSPDEFRVLRQAGTERPWTGEYVDTKTAGMYKCRACGADLYPSDTTPKDTRHCVNSLSLRLEPER
jgi:peptide-methionine (R)-S-oxide reductase